MKKNKLKGIIFTAIFVVGSLISGLLLIQLKSTLALDAGVLGAGEIEKAQPYITRVQLAVFTTFILGLIGYYFLQRQDSREIIYVDRKSTTSEKSETSTESSVSEKKKTSVLPAPFRSKKPQSEESLFKAICQEIDAVSGAYYAVKGNGKAKKLELTVPYALSFGESNRPAFEMGEGLVGQAAKEKNPLFIQDIPENAVMVKSGLGQACPTHLAILPVLHNNKVLGICEIGTFQEIDAGKQSWLKDVTDAFGNKIAPGKPTQKEKVKES